MTAQTQRQPRQSRALGSVGRRRAAVTPRQGRLDAHRRLERDAASADVLPGVPFD